MRLLPRKSPEEPSLGDAEGALRLSDISATPPQTLSFDTSHKLHLCQCLTYRQRSLAVRIGHVASPHLKSPVTDSSQYGLFPETVDDCSQRNGELCALATVKESINSKFVHELWGERDRSVVMTKEPLLPLVSEPFKDSRWPRERLYKLLLPLYLRCAIFSGRIRFFPSVQPLPGCPSVQPLPSVC